LLLAAPCEEVVLDACVGELGLVLGHRDGS
jgi:hypothetical protein